ncbi:persephin-like [Panulirus ornatus]|uniref:persephin-like n=1 Tax=Panulirus ornatus TaxID=150431 RepID=UPI003A8546E4
MVVRRRLLAWKAREEVAWRPFGGTDGGATVPDDATSAGASTTRARRRREASTECQVSRLVVSLEDLGLRQVVYPTTLFLNYCRGSCHILDHPGVFSTNALLRAKYKFLQGSGQVPAPHCTPVQYQEQPLFVWREGHLTMIRVDDLDATSCGCR